MLPVTNHQPTPLGIGSSRRCFSRPRACSGVQPVAHDLGLDHDAVAIHPHRDLRQRFGGRTVHHRAGPVEHAAVARTPEDLTLSIPRNQTAQMRARGVERGNLRFSVFTRKIVRRWSDSR